MNTARILLALSLAAALSSLLSCSEVFKAAREGEGDPLNYPQRSSGDIAGHQQETLEKVQDRSLQQ